MTVFAVLFEEPNPNLKAKIGALFEARFELAPGQTLVAVEGKTTQQVKESIAEHGEMGRIFVVPISNYAGWHRTDLWEWIKVNSGSVV